MTGGRVYELNPLTLYRSAYVVYCKITRGHIDVVLTFLFNPAKPQGSLSIVYGLLITRVSLKINVGMWLIVHDEQSKYSGLICF